MPKKFPQDRPDYSLIAKVWSLGAGIVFLASEQGEGVMLVRNPGGARGASRRGKFGRNMTTP